MRMVKDITGSILRTLASQGTEITGGVLTSLESAYVRLAQDYIERYAFDAAINGFEFDRHQEERAIEAFARALVTAGEHYLGNRLYAPLLPNWNRMVAALPEVMEWLEVLPYQDRKEPSA